MGRGSGRTWLANGVVVAPMAAQHAPAHQCVAGARLVVLVAHVVQLRVDLVQVAVARLAHVVAVGNGDGLAAVLI